MTFTIQRKLLLVFFSLILLLGSLGWISMNSLNKLNQASDEVIEEEIPSMQTILKIEELINSNYIILLRHINETMEAELSDEEKAFETNKAKITQLFTDYKNLIDSSQVDIFEKLSQQRLQFVNQAELAMSLSRQNKDTEALAKANEIKNTMEKLTGYLSQLELKDKNRVKEASTHIDEVYSSSLTTTIIFITVTIIVGIGLALYISRLISKPIQEVVKVVQDVANGDLSKQELKAKSNDEIAELVSATNKMINDLNKTLGTVNESSELVASSSEQLTASAEQNTEAAEMVSKLALESAQGAKDQLKNINDVAASIDEMTEGLEQISQNSMEMLEVTESASSYTQNGSNAINSVSNQMNAISESVDETTEVMEVLGKRSEEISNIIDLITDISNQTNLLSLNAAIEAARAGEHGKGFAVVADEVRGLAEKSKDSAERINVMIASIQEETKQAIESMYRGNQKVKTGLEYSNEARVAFTKIEDGINETTDKVQDVSSAVEQMSAISNQISDSIKKVKNVAQDSAENSEESSATSEEQLASMEEITSSAQSLSALSEELKKIISHFSLRNDQDEDNRL